MTTSAPTEKGDPMVKGYCIICNKMILPGEPAQWVKQKGNRAKKWYHTECLEKERKELSERRTTENTAGKAQ